MIVSKTLALVLQKHFLLTQHDKNTKVINEGILRGSNFISKYIYKSWLEAMILRQFVFFFHYIYIYNEKLGVFGFDANLK